MHPEAMDFLRNMLGSSAFTEKECDVLEIGARDINGSPRELFTKARYVGLDIADGPGVDIVADAADWTSDQRFDLVICTEVFEHAPRWRDIIKTAYAHLRSDGAFVGTAAGVGRAPHSAVNGDLLDAWFDMEHGYVKTKDGVEMFSIIDGAAVFPKDVRPEFYENITWDALSAAFHEALFDIYTIDEHRGHGDIRWWSEKFDHRTERAHNPLIGLGAGR